MMDTLCIGCSRCLVAFNRREGAFTVYEGQEVRLIGLLSCGDCPGGTLVPRLAVMKLWNAPLAEDPTKIHMAPCLLNCPHGDPILELMEARCGIEIVRGTHPYQMQTIFGP